jgi:hypothetical protein
MDICDNIPKRKSSLVLVRTQNTFLSFAETSADSPTSLSGATPISRSTSEPCMNAIVDDDDFRMVFSIPEHRSFSVDLSQKHIPPTPPSVLIKQRREPNHKLFVGGLSYNTDEAVLFEFMCQFGPVKNVTVKRNPLTGQSRRYAFVKFYNPPDGSVFNGPWVLDGHQIRITKYKVSPEWKNHFYSDDEGI